MVHSLATGTSYWVLPNMFLSLQRVVGLVMSSHFVLNTLVDWISGKGWYCPAPCKLQISISYQCRSNLSGLVFPLWVWSIVQLVCEQHPLCAFKLLLLMWITSGIRWFVDGWMQNSECPIQDSNWRRQRHNCCVTAHLYGGTLMKSFQKYSNLYYIHIG